MLITPLNLCWGTANELKPTQICFNIWNIYPYTIFNIMVYLILWLSIYFDVNHIQTMAQFFVLYSNIQQFCYYFFNFTWNFNTLFSKLQSEVLHTLFQFSSCRFFKEPTESQNSGVFKSFMLLLPQAVERWVRTSERLKGPHLKRQVLGKRL